MIGDENFLFDAAFKNDAAAIAYALSMGCDPNAQHSRSGTLPLQVACQANALEAIRALLDGGADPSRAFSRISRVDGREIVRHVPLMYVRSVDAAKMLLDAGADIDFADQNGWTPLVHAINCGEYDVCRYLIERKASTKVTITSKDRSMTLIEFLCDMHIEGHSVVSAKYNDNVRRIRDLLVHGLGGDET